MTGAGRGIGRGYALALAEAGARVVVSDLGCNPDGRGGSQEPAEAVVDEIQAAGGEAIAHLGDISKRA
ncbi:MAG: SDR family NAD(P)-dependent oxidoreductase, partial [Myxococcales bacterium]|nr:SDR family NAD(P)-dependent oxidoreductase [Myxococcales bacterium]